LISKHGDGEMISRVAERLGFKPVRGSSTRGGFQAMRELLGESAGGFDYAIMPDGPRGPCYEFKAGPIFLASRTGLPIVPITISFARCWRVRSWDRFILPCPFTRALIQVAPEVHVPAALSAEDTESWRRQLGEALSDVTADTDTRFEELYRSAGRYSRLRRPAARLAKLELADASRASGRGSAQNTPGDCTDGC
jgi:hypothetical protein